MKISFGKIWNYISERTEKTITISHPCILIDDNNKTLAFVFTHEIDYGIENKEEKYSYKSPIEMSTTRIKTNENLEIAREYYRNILKIEKNAGKIMDAKKYLKSLDNYGTECVCPFPASEKSYLSQEIPVFYDKNEYKFFPLPITEKKCYYTKDYENLEANKNKFINFLPIVEKALLNNVLYKYEPSTQNDKFELKTEKFSTNEKINLAWGIENEIKWQNHEPKIEQLEFIDSILEKGKKTLNNKELLEILEYKKELKIIDIEKSLSIQESKLEILEKEKKEIVLSNDIEKFNDNKKEIEETKAKIEELKKELNDSKEEKIELNEKNDDINDYNYEKIE